MTYDYARGDRLNDRNTYFYSTFCGARFLSEWEQSRQQALQSLPAPCEHSPRSETLLNLSGNGELEALSLLEYLKAALASSETKQPEAASIQVQPWLDRLLQRFEVTKRIYTRYNLEFRAAGEHRYTDMALYAGFGEVMELAYKKTSKLQYLNALIKLLDTLISRSMDLSEDVGGRTARLILQEQEHVRDLANRAGIPRW